MAQIRRRSPNTYTISVFLGRDSSGKRKFKHETFYGTPAQARLRASELETDIKRRCGPKSMNMTVEELMEKWLVFIEESMTKRSFKKYRWHVSRLQPLIGDLKLYDLKSFDLQVRLKKLEGLANRTIRDIYATVHNIFRQFKDWGMTSVNLSEGLKLPRKKHIFRDVFKKEELAKFLKNAKGYKHYLILKSMGVCGLRISEALGLSWRSIDFSRKTLTVLQAVDTHTREVKETKTDTSIRTIKIDDVFLAELNALKSSSKQTSENELVFQSEDGGPVRDAAVRKAMNRALKRAELRHIRIHDLRHGFISILIDEDVPLSNVAAVAGDKLETIVQVYAHNIRQGKGIGDILSSD